MNPLDIAIVGVLVVSAVVSFARGFFREVLSLAAWVAAVWIAVAYTSRLDALFQNYITVPALRMVAAFLVLFLSTLMLGALVNHLIGQLVKKTGFSGTDRTIGVVFGLIRGGVIVSVLVLLAGVTRLPQESWWHESMLAGHFQQMAHWMRDSLPSGVASSITYD